eukprot:1292893-Prymnesium_polylepis.1
MSRSLDALCARESSRIAMEIRAGLWMDASHSIRNAPTRLHALHPDASRTAPATRWRVGIRCCPPT